MASNFELTHVLETTLAKLGVSSSEFSSLFTDCTTDAISLATQNSQICDLSSRHCIFIFQTTNLNLDPPSLARLIKELGTVQKGFPTGRTNVYRILRYYSTLYVIHNENIVYKDISINGDRSHLITGSKFDLSILTSVQVIEHANNYMRETANKID